MSLTIRPLSSLDPSFGLGLQWEELVRENQASGIMQSLHWQEVKRRQHLSSIHLGVFKGDLLQGGGIFYTSEGSTGPSIMACPEGPVLPWDDQPHTTEALRLIIDTVQEHARSSGAIAMRIEPRLTPPPPRLLREFSRAALDLIPSETLYVDISQPENTLLGSMKEKGRYNIKLSGRNNVTVQADGTDSAIDRFYSVMEVASLRDGFALEPKLFFESLATVLRGRGCARVLFAEHEGDTLGTALLITYGSRATYLYGGITNSKRNLMGGYALQWQAMKLAKEAGCSTYDFYGFDPFRASDHPYARFSQFKSQFGGTPMKFIGAQEYYFVDNLADSIITLSKRTATRDRPDESHPA